jgi:hypothetical protein
MRSIYFFITFCFSCNSIDNATDRISLSIKNETKKKKDSTENSTSDNKIVVEKNKISIDSDGDGIADSIDKCPNEKGSIENFGCKKVIEKSPAKVEVHTKVIEKTPPKIRTKSATKVKPIKKKTTIKDGFIQEPNIEPNL